MTAPVNRILRSSIVDGPGNRAVVFVQGCNFSCAYCHNPETIHICRNCGACISVCPAGALSCGKDAPLWSEEKCALCDECLKTCPHSSSPRVRLMSAAEVMAQLEAALPYIRGVTVSGGECTLYPDFLRELAPLVTARGLTFFLDTNGSYDFSRNPALLEAMDAAMPDIKADPARPDEFRRVAGLPSGASVPDVIGNAAFLASCGKLHEVRTVVSPALFDAAPLVEKTCATLRNAVKPSLPINFRYKLISYRSVGVKNAARETLEPPSGEEMQRLAAICAKYDIPAVIV